MPAKHARVRLNTLPQRLTELILLSFEIKIKYLGRKKKKDMFTT